MVERKKEALLNTENLFVVRGVQTKDEKGRMIMTEERKNDIFSLVSREGGTTISGLRRRRVGMKK